MQGPGNHSRRNCMSTIVYQCIVIAGCKVVLLRVLYTVAFLRIAQQAHNFEKMAPLFNIIMAAETVL